MKKKKITAYQVRCNVCKAIMHRPNSGRILYLRSKKYLKEGGISEIVPATGWLVDIYGNAICADCLETKYL